MSLAAPLLRPFRAGGGPTGIPWPPELDGTIPNAPTLGQVVHAVHSPIIWAVERNPNVPPVVFDNPPTPWSLQLTVNYSTLPNNNDTFTLLGVTYRYATTPTTATDIHLPAAATAEIVHNNFISAVRAQLESVGISLVVITFGTTSVFRISPSTTAPWVGSPFSTVMPQFTFVYTPATVINFFANQQGLNVYCRVFARQDPPERNSLGTLAPLTNSGEWQMLGILKTPFDPDNSVFSFDVSRLLRPYVSTDLPFIGQPDGTTPEPGLIFNTLNPYTKWEHPTYLIRYALEFGLEFPTKIGDSTRIKQQPELKVGFPDDVNQQGLFAANAALADDSRITFENTYRQYWLPQGSAPFRKELLTQQPRYKRTHLAGYEMLSCLVDQYLVDTVGSFLSMQFRILLHLGGTINRYIPLGTVSNHFGMVTSHAGLLGSNLFPSPAVTVGSVKEYEAWFALSSNANYSNPIRITLSQFYQLEFAVADSRYEYAQLVFLNRLGAYDTLPFGTVSVTNTAEYDSVPTRRTSWRYLAPEERRFNKNVAIDDFAPSGQIDDSRQTVRDRFTRVSFTSSVIDRSELGWLRQNLIGSPEVYLISFTMLESAGSGLFRNMRKLIVEDVNIDTTRPDTSGVVRLEGRLASTSPHVNTF